MKKFLLLTITLFAFQISLAQDPYLQRGNDKFEKDAIELTDKYNEKLGLRMKQFNLFQKKVEEFMIRREKIEKSYKGKEKLDLLYALQKQETKEMNDILTQPQMEVYKNIKSKFQPLDVVEK